MSFLNLDETRDWLDIVYGDTPGLIHVCSTQNWAGHTFSGDDKTDRALGYIKLLDDHQVEGIYLRATTLRQEPRQGRGGDDLSLYLPGLWGDIDIAGPGHKSKGTLPPDVQAAMQIVAASGLPDPSHWIHSGGGLYPWWLLRSPVEIEDVEFIRSLSQGWQAALGRGALRLGYAYGTGVGDLSRVLRIPGTVNRKAGLERPCTMLEGHAWNGAVYDLDDLVHALTEATPAPPAPPQPSRLEVRMSHSASAAGEKPGDEFNRTASWRDILERHGWQWIRRQGDTWYLRRPGKLSGGHSATLRDSTDRLWVFSEEAAPLEAFRLYDKFGAFTTLEHHGDFRAATRFLADRGYGARRSVPLAQSFQAAPADETGGVSVPVSQAPPGPSVAPPPDPAPAITDVDALGLPIYGSDRLRHMKWNGREVSSTFVELHGSTFRYIPDQKVWMRWTGVRWEQDRHLRHEYAAQVMVQRMLERAEQVEQENPDVGKALVKQAKTMMHANQIAALLRNARSDPRLASREEDFDTQSHLLTLDNGVFDLDRMELLPHDCSLMLTRKINASFRPAAPQGRWYQFMQEVLPDQQVREYVQRVCGYMLTGSMDERVMMLFYGESGTGKTQFLEALSQVMGDFAGVAPASAFQPRQSGYKGPSEDLHKLRGTRFVMQSELDAGSRLNEPLVKSIVGADTQSTRPLYGAPVDWRPQYTVFLATNHLPRISSSENAIWNRVKPVHFGQVFINEQGQALDPSQRNLGKRMATTEADSILNWLLEGLAAYRARGLDEPEQVSAWLKQYREDVDTARQFIQHAPEDERIVLEEKAGATVTEVYKTYTAWCADNGITPLGMRNFNTRLESAGFERKKRERGIVWQGIGVPPGQWLAGNQLPIRYRAGDWAQRE